MKNTRLNSETVGAPVRMLSLLLLLAGIATVECNAQTKAVHRALAPPVEAYFDPASRQAVPPNVLAADKFSATGIGDVLTLLFDSAKVDLQTQNDALVGTWVGTVRVPINAGAKARASYVQHLRGSVDKTADTRVVVVVDVGGRAFTTEFPYGATRHGNFTHQFITPVNKRANAYLATVLIIAERRAPGSAVLVQVDGLDIDAKSGKNAKPTR